MVRSDPYSHGSRQSVNGGRAGNGLPKNNRNGRRSMHMKTLLAPGLMAGGLSWGQPASADVTLEMVVWNYSIDTIQDNLRKFEAANPGIKVNLTDYTWPDYQDSLILRFRGDTPTDVIYCG